MARALHQFAAIVTGNDQADPLDLDWTQVGYAETTQARAVWVARYAPAGAKVRLAAVRGVLKTAWRMGIIGADAYMRAVDVPAVRGESLPVGRALGDDEIARLFEACVDGKAAGIRDAAIFAVFRTGCRVDELCQLEISDYFPAIDPEPATVRIRSAKGNRQRLGYLDRLYDAFVRRWIDVRGTSPGPLFHALDARGKKPVPGSRLRRSGVNRICSRRSTAAGIEHFSPHDLRRTVATQLHEHGVGLSEIRDVLGHRDLETTARYFRHDKEKHKRRAAELLAKGGRK
jgi:integrase